MNEKLKEYIETAFIFVGSVLFFFYVVHPILADVAPILTFGSGGTARLRRPGGLGVLSLVATIMFVMYVYFFSRASIRYTRSHGVKSFLSNTALLFLVLILNQLLPERLYPDNVNITGEEDNDE